MDRYTRYYVNQSGGSSDLSNLFCIQGQRQ